MGTHPSASTGVLTAAQTHDLRTFAFLTDELDDDSSADVYLSIDNRAGTGDCYLVQHGSAETSSGRCIPAGEDRTWGPYTWKGGIPDLYAAANSAAKVSADIRYLGA